MRLIDADVLICKLHRKIGSIDNDRSFRREMMPVSDGMRIMELEYCIGLVQCEPVIDAVPVVHGAWMDQDYTFTRFTCTACGSKNHGECTNYCPHCGARMDAKETMDGGAEGE